MDLTNEWVRNEGWNLSAERLDGGMPGTEDFAGTGITAGK